jgi:cytochrome c-type biogenesis protein
LLLGAVWSPCVGPTLGAASILAAEGENLGQVALTMVAFGVGAALPLIRFGLLSREAFSRWRGWLMEAGKGGKVLLGGFLIVIGLMVATHRQEARDAAGRCIARLAHALDDRVLKLSIS